MSECTNCEERPAALHCAACDEQLCSTCDQDFHRSAKKRYARHTLHTQHPHAHAHPHPSPDSAHKRTPITAAHTRVSSAPPASPAAPPARASVSSRLSPRPRLSPGVPRFGRHHSGVGGRARTPRASMSLRTSHARARSASPGVSPRARPSTERAGSTDSQSSGGRQDGQQCEVCEDAKATLRCDECDQVFCEENGCDAGWHRGKKRTHKRTKIGAPAAKSQASAGAHEPVCGVCEDEAATIHCGECNMYFCEANGCDAGWHRGKKSSHSRQSLSGGPPPPKRSPPPSRPAVSRLSPRPRSSPRPSPRSRSTVVRRPVVTKSPAPAPSAGSQQCEVCEDANATVRCDECDQVFCEENGCDAGWHRGKKRTHKRTRIGGGGGGGAGGGSPDKQCEVCEDAKATIRCDECDQVFCEENGCDAGWHRGKKRTHRRVKIGSNTVVPVRSPSPSPVARSPSPRPVVRPPAPVRTKAAAPPSKPSPGGQVCSVCEDEAATVNCVQCKRVFCTTNGCDAGWHKGKRRMHRRVPLLNTASTKPQTAPMVKPATTTTTSATTTTTASGQVCSVCEDEPATVNCVQCKRVFCTTNGCDAGWHKGKRRLHRRVPLTRPAMKIDTNTLSIDTSRAHVATTPLLSPGDHSPRTPSAPHPMPHSAPVTPQHGREVSSASSAGSAFVFSPKTPPRAQLMQAQPQPAQPQPALSPVLHEFLDATKQGLTQLQDSNKQMAERLQGLESKLSDERDKNQEQQRAVLEKQLEEFKSEVQALKAQISEASPTRQRTKEADTSLVDALTKAITPLVLSPRGPYRAVRKPRKPRRKPRRKQVPKDSDSEDDDDEGEHKNDAEEDEGETTEPKRKHKHKHKPKRKPKKKKKAKHAKAKLSVEVPAPQPVEFEPPASDVESQPAAQPKAPHARQPAWLATLETTLVPRILRFEVRPSPIAGDAGPDHAEMMAEEQAAELKYEMEKLQAVRRMIEVQREKMRHMRGQAPFLSMSPHARKVPPRSRRRHAPKQSPTGNDPDVVLLVSARSPMNEQQARPQHRPHTPRQPPPLSPQPRWVPQSRHRRVQQQNGQHLHADASAPPRAHSFFEQVLFTTPAPAPPSPAAKDNHAPQLALDEDAVRRAARIQRRIDRAEEERTSYKSSLISRYLQQQRAIVGMDDDEHDDQPILRRTHSLHSGKRSNNKSKRKSKSKRGSASRRSTFGQGQKRSMFPHLAHSRG